MGEKIKNYLQFASNLDTSSMSQDEKEKQEQRMLIEISFFQHERLIHLIVTVIFALLAIIVAGLYLLTEQWNILLLLALIILLLVPYIKHYFLLENSVQRLYDIFDEKFPIKKFD